MGGRGYPGRASSCCRSRRRWHYRLSHWLCDRPATPGRSGSSCPGGPRSPYRCRWSDSRTYIRRLHRWWRLWLSRPAWSVWWSSRRGLPRLGRGWHWNWCRWTWFRKYRSCLLCWHWCSYWPCCLSNSVQKMSCKGLSIHRFHAARELHSIRLLLFQMSPRWCLLHPLLSECRSQDRYHKTVLMSSLRLPHLYCEFLQLCWYSLLILERYLRSVYPKYSGSGPDRALPIPWKLSASQNRFHPSCQTLKLKCDKYPTNLCSCTDLRIRRLRSRCRYAARHHRGLMFQLYYLV